jgi:hypothetical protein
MISRSGRVTASLVTIASVLSLAACDVPTGMPHWDTTWALPIETLELTAEDLLPADVMLTPDRSAFELQVAGTEFQKGLSEFCSACRLLDGLHAPKPAFKAELTSTISLPADLVSAQVTGGSVRIELFHDFGFDPIRPSAAARGSIEVLLTSGNDTLAAGVIDGVVEPFPSGDRKVLQLPYLESTLRDSIRVVLIIDSPSGDPVLIDSSRRLMVTVAPSRMHISEARAHVQDLAIELEETTLDIVGGEGLVNRIRSGALLLEIDNPFQVTGSLQIVLSAPGISVARQLPLGPGHTENRAEFGGNELRSILRDESATLSAFATVTAGGGPITIRPDHVLKAKSRFDLTVATREN